MIGLNKIEKAKKAKKDIFFIMDMDDGLFCYKYNCNVFSLIYSPMVYSFNTFTFIHITLIHIEPMLNISLPYPEHKFVDGKPFAFLSFERWFLLLSPL